MLVEFLDDCLELFFLTLLLGKSLYLLANSGMEILTAVHPSLFLFLFLLQANYFLLELLIQLHLHFDVATQPSKQLFKLFDLPFKRGGIRFRKERRGN